MREAVAFDIHGGRRRRPTAEQMRDVREILRGLEAIGMARCAGGWWRRV